MPTCIPDLASIQRAKNNPIGISTKKNAPFIDIEGKTVWNELTTIMNIVAGPRTEENIKPAAIQGENHHSPFCPKILKNRYI